MFRQCLIKKSSKATNYVLRSNSGPCARELFRCPVKLNVYLFLVY